MSHVDSVRLFFLALCHLNSPALESELHGGGMPAPKIHPVANAFPMIVQRELEELAGDIKRNGLLVPIELHDGKVIDGRNRLAACELAGVEPHYVDVDLNGMTPAEYVWSINGTRRHLTASQRAAIAVELLPELEAEAKERMSEGGKGMAKMPQAEKGKARDKAANQANVGARYVSDAKKVREKSPELFNEVKQGTRTLSQAKQEVKRNEQRKDLAEKAAKVKPSAEQKVILGDCIEELTRLKQVQLIFADPPYNIGVDYGRGTQADTLSGDAYLSWCSEWINCCANVLTASGSMWVLVPDEHAEYIAAMLNDAGLHRRAWVKWYETFGVNCTGNFNRTSRHLFYYVANQKSFTFNADAVSRPSDRQAKYNDKRASPAGKVWDDVWQIPRLTGTSKERLADFPTQLPLSLVEAVVGCSSSPGDLVVDPFSGSGTTGVACKKLGRKYIGIEREELSWERSSVRIATS